MPKKHVAIRMYRIGFGDAFLMIVPTDDGERTVLVDCGRHFQTPKKKVGTTAPPPEEAAIVERIVKDVTKDSVARIDLVIATHRHQDHVSGFANKLWNSVEVGEVWMPWTEHPTDKDAARIRNRQSALAQRLLEDGKRLGITDVGFRGLVANSLSNASAMKTLHSGFRGKPRRRFLEGKMQTLKPTILPGVRVHVLGPAREEDIIRDMDPPSGQHYLRASRAKNGDGKNGDGKNGHGAKQGPFAARWTQTKEDVAAVGKHLVATPAMVRHMKELLEGDPMVVAATLEKAVNGTSLMLAFEVGDAMLFFPGDAQWGTWKRALASAKARNILERTTFFKIGHHGSHNATPRAFVEELLGDDVWTMASVWPVARFPRIPKSELMARLLQKSDKVARADVTPKKHFTHDDEVIEARVPVG